MFSYIVFFVSVILIVKSSESEWLPKCCPEGKLISPDGKSCVQNSLKELPKTRPKHLHDETYLPVVVEDKELSYRLDFHSTFNCVRHEVYVVKDDLFVTDDGNVLIFDDFGNWTLRKSELCVDGVFVNQDSASTLFVALLCPSCDRLPCLHKCCPESKELQVNDDGTVVDCMPSSLPSWSDKFMKDTSKKPFVFHGFPECPHSLYLDFTSRPLGLSDNSDLQLRRMTVPRAEYCGDMSARGSALLGCRQLVTAAAKPLLYGGLFCLGSVFLVLTLAVYLWLPELRRTLHSRVLIAHLACLLAGYLGLAVVNLAPIPTPSTLCSTTAFTIQFSILASIFWLNIMCVDIAWTFSGLRAPKASSGLDSDGHKFLYYSLYAWGSTAAISAVTAFLEYSPMVPSSSRLKPAFGATSCWFQHWEAILLLVYGPMALLLLANIVLFVYTAYKIQRTQRDTANIVTHSGSHLRENKDRFSLYLKLFGLMGVTWVFEVVSWLVGGPDSYWYITDVINALRSVFIFVLFCLKKKVLMMIKAKLGFEKGTNHPKHQGRSASSKRSSSMSSHRTNSFQLSQIS